MKLAMLNTRGHRTDHNTGFALLESLFAILIVSFGIIGIMGLQINSISDVRNSKVRSDAGLLTDEMIGLLWADRQNIGTYALNAGGAVCALGANTSTNATVTNWISEVTKALPGAASYGQIINIGANNLVTVTICWKNPQDTSPHNFSASSQIQG